MAITKKKPELKKGKGRQVEDDEPADDEEEAPEEEVEDSGHSGDDESEDDDDGSPNEAPEEDESEEAPSPKAKAKPDANAAPDPALVKLFEKYDSFVREAEVYFVKLVEFIQDKQVDRNTVVASMMRARGITYEAAQSQYSRMKKIFNNEEILQELKEGKITLKVAREKTKTTQTNPKSAKPEAKEARFTSTLKAFIAAVKESGLSWKECLVTLEAERKSAQIK